MGEKPKVQDRRYLRPDEAHRLIDAAGKRGRYPFRDKVLLRLVYLATACAPAGRSTCAGLSSIWTKVCCTALARQG